MVSILIVKFFRHFQNPMVYKKASFYHVLSWIFWLEYPTVNLKKNSLQNHMAY